MKLVDVLTLVFIVLIIAVIGFVGYSVYDGIRADAACDALGGRMNQGVCYEKSDKIDLP